VSSEFDLDRKGGIQPEKPDLIITGQYDSLQAIIMLAHRREAET
jgi:hypothetical protein